MLTSPELVVRDAEPGDAGPIAAIGTAAMRAQYAELVDAAAIEAAVEQTYSTVGLIACIYECSRSDRAFFIVAEEQGSIVGYLHYDSFGPEPELHRLYVDPSCRSRGVGGRLMDELHSRQVDPRYMLLVMSGNVRAVAFYQRHGLCLEGVVDGLVYYRERMGVTFPAGTDPFELILMRHSPSRTGTREREM